MSKKLKISLTCLFLFAIVTLIVWIEAGLRVEWGPFRFLAFDKREKEIIEIYDAAERKNEIIFYGASNFRLWKEMDEDMLPFIVQNHGFGGSADEDLMERADTLLYPYEPAIVVFQTGSNDYAKLSGTPEEIAQQVIEQKKVMFTTFHDKLPDTKFVVISGILMPGRSQYDDTVKSVNQFLREYCEEVEYMYFVDAESMTIDETGNHIADMFIEDGIHLTHDTRVKWANEYIKPVLETVMVAIEEE